MLKKSDYEDDRQKKLSLSDEEQEEDQTDAEELGEVSDERLQLMPFKLQRVELHLIDSAVAQPEGRDKNIADLSKVIGVSGFIVPPMLQRKSNSPTSRYVALDGHRRIAAAKARGETSLQCLIMETVSPLKRTEMFIQANVATHPLNGIERVKSYCQLTTRAQKDAMLANLKKPQAKQIRVLEQIFGEQRLSELAGEGKALASAPTSIRCILSWCTAYGLDRLTERVIGEWVIRWKMSRTIDTAARKITGRTAQAIVNCIHANRRFDRTM